MALPRWFLAHAQETCLVDAQEHLDVSKKIGITRQRPADVELVSDRARRVGRPGRLVVAEIDRVAEVEAASERTDASTKITGASSYPRETFLWPEAPKRLRHSLVQGQVETGHVRAEEEDHVDAGARRRGDVRVHEGHPGDARPASLPRRRTNDHARMLSKRRCSREKSWHGHQALPGLTSLAQPLDGSRSHIVFEDERESVVYVVGHSRGRLRDVQLASKFSDPPRVRQELRRDVRSPSTCAGVAKIEVKSAQKGVASVWIEIDGVSDVQVRKITKDLERLLSTTGPSDAVAETFCRAVRSCPTANPSDLWQHVIYRGLLDLGKTDQQWKRISGFALERALVELYREPLHHVGVRMRILKSDEVVATLKKLGLTDAVKKAKVDLFLEGTRDGELWQVFGVAHVKASIAERIQDDVPASEACMDVGLLSIALTLDSKSFPPPHGKGINYGELGGRDFSSKARDRPKRDYIEKDGQFDALFSFNLRTPPSTDPTLSGKKIYTLSFSGPQPDVLVRFIRDAWAARSRQD
jgi:hypothetical protein